MARVTCKDEAHDGDTAWVDRDDALLVRRSVGGAYNRAPRMQDSLICLACASRIIAHIEEQGGARGHRLHNRWSISDLQHSYAVFRRSRGLEPKVIVPGSTPEELEAERARIREGRRDDSEIAPGEDPAPRSYDTMPIAHLTPKMGSLYAAFEPKTPADSTVSPETAQEQAAFYEWASKHVGIDYTEAQKEQAKARIRRIPEAYGGLVPRKPGEFHHHVIVSGDAMSTCTICGKGLSERCAGPDAEAWEERMQARRDLKDRIFHLAYGMSKEGHATAADEMAKFNAETLRLFPDRFREPTPEEQAERERFVELVSAPLTPTFQQTAAEALRAIRERQGRPLHEARPLSLVPDTLPRIDVAKPDLQQGSLTEAEERYLAKARRQQDELNEQIRAAKEAAWDEGREAEAEAHFADGGYGNVQHPENPYRSTT